MSSDDYTIIRKHPLGGFAAVKGFDSCEGMPEAKEGHHQYPTVQDALDAVAEDLYPPEYGVSIHPECSDHFARKTLDEMAQEVWEWAQSKGWEPNPARTFGDVCALLHSEVSEALEEFRTYHDTIGHYETYGEGGPFLWETTSANYGNSKPLGVPSEFADILIRLLHYAAAYGIDLEAEYEAKMAYNRSRPYRHGGKAL